MNIFLLDTDIDLCVQAYPDSHVNKMILEYAQILCTVKHLWGQSSGVIPYKPTHQNHPCVKFIAENYDHYTWLWTLAFELSIEREHRWPDKPLHKSTLVLCHTGVYPIEEKRQIILLKIRQYGLLAPLEGKPPQAMPIQYRQEDPIKAYQDYFWHEKQHLFKWTGRPTPQWILTRHVEERSLR